MIIIKNREVTRFIKSFIIIGMCIFLVDLTAGFGLRYLYCKQQSGLLYRTSYAIDSTRANYVVLGASRANHHYDPKIFEDVLKTSFYNCGRDRQGVLYSCAVLSSILNRYSPKEVIIEIRPDEFTQSEEGELSSLLPYYKNQAIKPYLNFNGKFQDVKLLSHVYPYNSMLTNLIVGLKHNWSDDYKGYVKKTNTINDGPITEMKEKPFVDSTKIKAFYNFLATLKSRNIPAMLVISPLRYHYVNSYTTNVCKTACNKFNNIAFVNYSNKPQWMDHNFYSDDYHLNSFGAKIFSKDLANYISMAHK